MDAARFTCDLQRAMEQALSQFDANLPDVLKVAVEQLRLRAQAEPELAGRALHHLYRLAKETAA